MEFKDKSVVVTGGAQGIGKCIAECFEREGATVHVIDKQDGPWFVGDLADKATLERFAADILAKSDKVDVLINNAMPLFKGIDAEYASGELKPDGDEVVESGWFERGSLPEIPRPGSIARTMLDAWVKGDNHE